MIQNMLLLAKAYLKFPTRVLHLLRRGHVSSMEDRKCCCSADALRDSEATVTIAKCACVCLRPNGTPSCISPPLG